LDFVIDLEAGEGDREQLDLLIELDGVVVLLPWYGWQKWFRLDDQKHRGFGFDIHPLLGS
jgi:hypothetical protein